MGETGYFSAANVNACEAQGIEPMLSMKRESHHIPVLQRFAPDAPAPETDDPVVRMAHRLGTKEGRVLYGLRKQTVEPVFGIIKRVMGWSQMSMRGLDKARQEEIAMLKGQVEEWDVSTALQKEQRMAIGQKCATGSNFNCIRFPRAGHE